VREAECTRGLSLIVTPGRVRPVVSGNTIVGVRVAGIYLGDDRAAGQRHHRGSRHRRLRAGDLSATRRTRGRSFWERVSGCRIGLALLAQTAAVASNNVLENCEVGVDLFGSTGVVLTRNVSPGSATATRNVGSNAVLP
jgi:hypothetical protein